MKLENYSMEHRAAVVDAVMGVLGITMREARDARRVFLKNGGVRPRELHIPINNDFDFRLFGMKVVIDGETDSIFVKER